MTRPRGSGYRRTSESSVRSVKAKSTLDLRRRIRTGTTRATAWSHFPCRHCRRAKLVTCTRRQRARTSSVRAESTRRVWSKRRPISAGQWHHACELPQAWTRSTSSGRHVLNGGLDFELDALGLTIKREPSEPLPPSLSLPGPTPMNANRGTKRKTPDLGDTSSLAARTSHKSAPDALFLVSVCSPSVVDVSDAHVLLAFQSRHTCPTSSELHRRSALEAQGPRTRVPRQVVRPRGRLKDPSRLPNRRNGWERGDIQCSAQHVPTRQFARSAGVKARSVQRAARSALPSCRRDGWPLRGCRGPT